MYLFSIIMYSVLSLWCILALIIAIRLRRENSQKQKDEDSAPPFIMNPIIKNTDLKIFDITDYDFVYSSDNISRIQEQSIDELILRQNDIIKKINKTINNIVEKDDPIKTTDRKKFPLPALDNRRQLADGRHIAGGLSSLYDGYKTRNR